MADTLGRIERLNPQIGAFVRTWPGAALDAVEVAESNRSRAAGALWGVPSADKDLVNRAGIPTGWGSRATTQWPVPTESDPMALWLDRTGAISVGKTATSEFGLTGYTETEAFGPTRNLHHTDLGVGGSSGGAASAVASGMLRFAPGSDGGGSIRIPALACGIAGLKPSRGRVPAYSGFESLSSMVVPGIVARTIEDLADVSDALFSGDYRWSTRAPALASTLSAARRAEVTGLKIAVTTTTPWSPDVDCPLDPAAQKALDAAIRALEDAGHDVVPWDWTPLPGYFSAFSSMWQASTAGLELSDRELDLVEPLTRHLVERGREMSAAQLVVTTGWLRRFEQNTIDQLDGWDALLTPGLATLPPPIGWYSSDPEENFLQQIRVTPYTSFVNVAGLPAVVLPTHYTDQVIPMGVQLVGPPGREDTIITLAQQVESRVDAVRWPSLVAQTGPS
jgi:amidase